MSLLEIQIKISLKKLEFDFPVRDIPVMAEDSGLMPLALSNSAIFMLPKLPEVHRDPFDRLLICEAIQEGVAIVTPDKTFCRYPVKVIWLPVEVDDVVPVIDVRASICFTAVVLLTSYNAVRSWAGTTDKTKKKSGLFVPGTNVISCKLITT